MLLLRRILITQEAQDGKCCYLPDPDYEIKLLQPIEPQ